MSLAKVRGLHDTIRATAVELIEPFVAQGRCDFTASYAQVFPISIFMALVGVEASSIRQAAAEPGFLAAVTGFLMAHEPTLLAFCTENDVQAERVAACHHKLAGPESENWP